MSPKGVIPVVALEVEWYLQPENHVDAATSYIEDFLERLRVNAAHLPLHSVSPERGYLQVEAALLPTKDISQLIAHYKELCILVEKTAQDVSSRADFSAKPHADDYGSAIHVHVHLEDENGQLLFFKENDLLSDALRYSIGGLLTVLENDLAVFIPTEKSWQRIVPGFHAPVNASWGFNNRTTAIRLPDGIGDYQDAKEIAATAPSHFKRIEHRVAGSDADIEKVITAILKGIEKGLAEKLEPGAPIFGNASDTQYGLKRFNFFDTPPALRGLDTKMIPQ